MNDSSPPGHHRLGDAALAVSLVHGLSAATTAWARSPMKLLTPRSRGESVWAYTSSFGGGMVAGDRTRLEVTVDPGACCFLGTQASTKIYRNPAHLPCSHELIAKIDDDALLILAPDPVQCFADSSYEQRQHFTLSPSANLLLIDWMSGGRTARGERWSFHRYLSRNEIERDGRKVLIDALSLDSRDGALDSKYRGGRFNCLATVALFGPRLAELRERDFGLVAPLNRLRQVRAWFSPPAQSRRARCFALPEPVSRKSGARFTSDSASCVSCCKTIRGRGNGKRPRMNTNQHELGTGMTPGIKPSLASLIRVHLCPFVVKNFSHAPLPS